MAKIDNCQELDIMFILCPPVKEQIALRAIYADDLEKGSIVRRIYFLLTSILKRAASSV
jgi:hypothetical protein